MLPIWFLFIALATEVMAAVVGFGSSTILTPLATFVFDIKTALAVVAVFHIAGAATRLVRFRPAIDQKFFVQFGLPAIVATLLGSLLVRALPSQSLALLLGFFLLLLVIYEWTHPRFQLPRRESYEVVSGALTGFFGGLLGAGGAVRAVSLQAFGMKKEEYIGTSALMAVVVDLVRITVYAASGYLAGIGWGMLVGLMLLGVVGTLIGLTLVDRLPQKIFRLVVLGAVLFAALKLLSGGFVRG